jgi:hypothetical protein
MDEEDRKPAANNDQETIEDIKSNDNLMVDPTDNLDDQQLYFQLRCQSTKTLLRITTPTMMDPSP